MNKRIIIDYDEYVVLSELAETAREVIKNVPEIKINVHGFTGEHESILVMEKIKDVDKFLFRYEMNYEQQKRTVNAIEKNDLLKRKIDEIKRNKIASFLVSILGIKL